MVMTSPLPRLLRGGHPQVAFSHDHHETQCDLFLPFQSSFLFTSLFRFVSLCHFSNSCAYCYFTRMFVCLRRMTYVQFDTGRLFSHSSAARGKFYLKSQTHMSDDGELWCDRRFGDFFSRRHILSSFPKVFFIQTFEMNNSIFIVSGFLKGLDVILGILYMRVHIF